MNVYICIYVCPPPSNPVPSSVRTWRVRAGLHPHPRPLPPALTPTVPLLLLEVALRDEAEEAVLVGQRGLGAGGVGYFHLFVDIHVYTKCITPHRREDIKHMCIRTLTAIGSPAAEAETAAEERGRSW